MARPTKLSDPDYAKAVAAAFVAGLSHQQIADQFEVHKDTIANWRRDPRVKAHAMKMVEDRVLTVTRKIDAIIEGRLQHAENLSMKDLVMLRKEMLGGTLRQQTENADEGTVSEVMTALDENPQLGEQLAELLASGGKLPAPAAD
jgi:transposase